MTNEGGTDRCIDSVGAEAHGLGNLSAVIDRVKAEVGLATDRPEGLRQAIIS